MMTRIRVFVLLLASVWLAAGCAERPLMTGSVPAIDGPYQLDSGDELRIVVYDQPSLSNLYEVNQAGNISFPLVGDVMARDATTDQLEGRIAGALAASYLRNPNVTVEVASYRPFFALGEVGDPGQYDYVPGMTAETAIAKAGGFTDRANVRVVRVTRKINGRLHDLRIGVTDPIRPGDTIYVSERLI
jgi:polysaccharide export outer membrane protein